jgi:6-phosphogluconolactonase
MSEVEWWEFESAAEMAEQAAGDIGFVIESAIEAHGGARLALPGRNLPSACYDALLEQDIDWAKVTIVPTDDLLVSADDERSAFAQLDALFGAEGADVISLVSERALGDYREAGRLADERLAALDWPLDLVCLATGDDGHPASLLPGPDLDRALSGPRGRRAVGLHPDPMPASAPFDRVTLTADALASARTVMIIAVGGTTRQLIEEAAREGPLSDRPVGRLLSELDVDVDLFWCPAES